MKQKDKIQETRKVPPGYFAAKRESLYAISESDAGKVQHLQDKQAPFSFNWAIAAALLILLGLGLAYFWPSGDDNVDQLNDQAILAYLQQDHSLLHGKLNPALEAEFSELIIEDSRNLQDEALIDYLSEEPIELYGL